MWVLTPRGFFSVVQDRGDANRLLVRTRVRTDLEALRDVLPGLEPTGYEGADYPWRAWVDRGDWARVLEAMCEEINYSNFKNTVADRQGGSRAAIYRHVWTTLHRLERSVPETVTRPPLLPERFDRVIAYRRQFDAPHGGKLSARR